MPCCFHDFRAHPDREVERLTAGDGWEPHQEGGEELVRRFLRAVADHHPAGDLTGLDEALTSHRTVLAERALRSGETVPTVARIRADLDELRDLGATHVLLDTHRDAVSAARDDHAAQRALVEDAARWLRG